MSRKTVFYIIGLVCIVSSIAMYMIGKDSGHLSELMDFWWMPLPLAAIALLIANRKK